MTSATRAVRVGDLTLAPDSYRPPVKPLEDSVLIIYSAEGTCSDQIREVERAVNSYERKDIRTDRLEDDSRLVRTCAKVFTIPSGVSPGSALSTELTRDLKICLGAIAFVDDLRPNIAYELGFFHGKGARVLLLTSSAVPDSWLRLSDLAGAAIAQYCGETIKTVVQEYLDVLFADLEVVDRWPSYTLPRPENNLLAPNRVGFTCKVEPQIVEHGDFGRQISIGHWDCPLDFAVNCSISSEARFKVALRSRTASEYSVYFETAFADAHGVDRQLWLGLSSWLKRADFRSDERNLPSDPANQHWRFITGTFAGLLRRGHIFYAQNLVLKRVRFRVGEPHSKLHTPLDIGYLEIIGLQ